MNFGILHFGRPELALLEALRILRGGGRFAFSVWAKPEETIGFDIVLRAVELTWRAARRTARRPAIFSLQRSR